MRFYGTERRGEGRERARARRKGKREVERAELTL